MQTPGDLVRVLVEFSSGMKDGEHHLECAFPVLLHPVDRDPPPVILNSHGTVPVDAHPDMVAVSCKCFVDRIIHNLVDEMMEPACIGTPDVHGRAFPYWLQTLQYRDMRCIVRIGQSRSSVKKICPILKTDVTYSICRLNT
ncbi:MAG: hypothetical protein A4E38_00659 [Methanoregulaceae archaeon PtaB.Bin108]|nr:MAG: hypothetical protein A4E38_00659 [Methanoregulaceae archaeon PtaB.Bin108]OPY42777.1 MAG: hypothetical protein A4E42_01535 [Methanoregulaceae archaeon PtaU1.Bin222]